MLALLLIAASAAEAPAPCVESTFETAATLKSILGLTPRVVSPELKATRAVTCELIGGVTVCDMDYDPQRFDCDDYAWCFDQECSARGVACWQVNIGGRGPFRWSRWSGHGLNIIQADLPGDPPGVVRFAVVEPQQRDKEKAAVATWTQPAGTQPQIPESAYPDIAAAYPFFDAWNQAVYILKDGHSPKAGEAPFIQDPATVQEFREKTGLDPSGYDPTPVE